MDRTAPDPIEAYWRAEAVFAAYKAPPTPRKATPHGATAPHPSAHDQTKPRLVPEEEMAEINEALHDPRVKAFLHLLRFEEHNREGDEVYRIRYGDLAVKDPILDEEMGHYVGKVMSYTKEGKPITPAGAYQITSDTYSDAKKAGLVSDFFPASQEK